MAPFNERQLEIINQHPLKSVLDAFRTTFKSTHPRMSSHNVEAFEKIVSDDLVGRTQVLQLVNTLMTHPTATLLPAYGKDNGALVGDMGTLYGQLASGVSDIKHTARLLQNVIADEDDATIWATAYKLIGDTKPPHSPISSHRPTYPKTPPRSAPTRSFKETPTNFHSGSTVGTSEQRKDIDPLLNNEVRRNLISNHPGIFDAFYGRVSHLEDVANAVFDACKSSDPPRFVEGTGWTDWSSTCSEDELQKTVAFNQPSVDPSLPDRTKPFAAPPTNRKLDVGIMTGTASDSEPVWWSNILIAGELKSNRGRSTSLQVSYDIAKYAREVLSSQDTRRFALGFTLCGSLMRLWEFDRLGCVGSTFFDIQTEGQRFVSVVLGWLWMNDQDLGFDPTISKHDDGTKYLDIQRSGRSERIRLERTMIRQRVIAGRATTCWEGRIEGDSDDNSDGGSDGSPQRVVVKDSWEYEDRPEEGPLLEDATAAGVDHIARHYHHETVHVGGIPDDVIGNIRKELGPGGRSDSKSHDSQVTAILTGSSSQPQNRGDSRASNKSLKRSSDQTTTSQSSKRPRLDRPPNRVHRRVVMQDVGKDLYRASSLRAMLTGLIGGLKGHESLLVKAGILHRDISIGNVMLNDAEDDGFLIDLDLAIKMDREEASGAPSKTGTKVFMAVGPLYGEPHLGVHDKESFFWLLFWIGVHWNGPEESATRSDEYDAWNGESTNRLGMVKNSLATEVAKFRERLEVAFTPFCRPLIPFLEELRAVVFPDKERRKVEDPELYGQMVSVLEKAKERV
ncbi:serine threonine-protein kinase sgk2 [Diplodia corticola]|uniref:non-specific serine/threonine protein kinase n=1 Tax=Diplodia corticola TaxID=236234 RepID=A0A1J9RMG7_9PEZI|nr:serine threonine-protein kinase sgk2 [Diplodia corticola]OJD29703.1 serine threonine-protein kinase sgk2 [Diplodia corticola]